MTTAAKEPTGLALLRKPFPPHQISKLPKPLSRDGKKGKCDVCGGFHMLPAVHLDYVGHAALTDRLLDADLSWSWAPLALTAEGLPRFDPSGGLWITLTVCGVTRLGYGHAEAKSYADIGAREKEVIGDALRNAAMRFGAALDLWHKGELHPEQEPEKPQAPALPPGTVRIVRVEPRAKGGVEWALVTFITAEGEEQTLPTEADPKGASLGLMQALAQEDKPVVLTTKLSGKNRKLVIDAATRYVPPTENAALDAEIAEKDEEVAR